MKGHDSEAFRKACQLAAVAVRQEVRKLDRLAKQGLLVDKEQRQALASIGDELQAASVGQQSLLGGLAGSEGQRRRIGFGGGQS